MNTSDIARWAEEVRDVAAFGLLYAENFYDRERYARLKRIAIEMATASVGASPADLTPLQESLYDGPGPLVGADAAIFDDEDRILLIRRSDNGLWAMPGGAAEVGERPADAAAREALEETGVQCQPVGLVGVYDNRLWGSSSAHHVYMLLFACVPVGQTDLESEPSHSLEVTDRAWFGIDELPDELDPRHERRIPHAFEYRLGGRKTYFDQ